MKTIVSYAVWPFFVVAGIFASYLGLRSGYPLPVAFLAVNFALMVLVGAAEQLLPYRKDWNALTDPQSFNDVGHAVLENQIGDLLGGAMFLTLAAGLAARLTGFFGRPVWPTGWPLLAQVVLVVVLADGLDYWKHRFLHTVPWLWRCHALHHGITQLHVLKASRLHFTDLLTRFVMVYSPLVVLGTPPEVIFWYTSFISILGVIGHANVEMRVPAPLHRLLMTPQVHRLHHSVERAVSDSNYVNIIPMWDILFGSFSDPDRHELAAVGVVDDPIPPGFLGQLFAPLTWSRLVKQEPSANVRK